MNKFCRFIFGFGFFKYVNLVLFALIGYGIGQFFVSPPKFYGTDFSAWGGDWARFICTLNKGDGCGVLSKFPLAYLFNSLVAWLWGGEFSILFMNSLFFICSALFLWFVCESKARKFCLWAYLASVLFSAVPSFYVNSGAIELQYGVVLGCYFVCIYFGLIKREWSGGLFAATFLSAFFLPIYKDVSVAYMALGVVGAICMSSSARSLRLSLVVRESSRVLLVHGMAVFLSLCLIFSYNYFRYQSFLPVAYLDEASNTVMPVGVKIENLFWIFFSPNGGLGVAWSASFLALFAVLWAGGRAPSRFGVFAAVGLVLIVSFVLANWWSPFGWNGWGNRLILPATVASLMVLAATSERTNIEIDSLGRKAGFVVCAFVLSVFLISAYYVLLSYSAKRDVFLDYSLQGPDSCKAVETLLPGRPAFEFKKSELNLECHRSRFSYIPGVGMDLSRLGLVENRKYEKSDLESAGVLGKGWSGFEGWGVWSSGMVSEVRFVPKENFSEIIFSLNPFLYGSLSTQRIKISFEGATLINTTLGSSAHVKIAMPKGWVFDPDKIVRFVFELPDASSPVDLGLNGDTRVLGVGLTAIEFR